MMDLTSGHLSALTLLGMLVLLNMGHYTRHREVGLAAGAVLLVWGFGLLLKGSWS